MYKIVHILIIVNIDIYIFVYYITLYDSRLTLCVYLELSYSPTTSSSGALS